MSVGGKAPSEARLNGTFTETTVQGGGKGSVGKGEGYCEAGQDLEADMNLEERARRKAWEMSNGS